jgi:hypothetical protein
MTVQCPGIVASNKHCHRKKKIIKAESNKARKPAPLQEALKQKTMK